MAAEKRAESSSASVNAELREIVTHKLDKSLPETTVSIYRVSAKFRNLNEEAYTPRLVSVGPIHHKKSHLQSMEARKLRWLKGFMEKHSVDLAQLIDSVAEDEVIVRSNYEDTSEFKSTEFSQLMLLDAVFVIQLLLKNHFPAHTDPTDSIVFGNRWILNDVVHDMLLIENQLPLIFIRKLFKFVDPDVRAKASLDKLIWEFFKNVGNTVNVPLGNSELSEARHFVEFLLNLHVPKHGGERPPSQKKVEYTRRAAELKQAGVKFEKAEQSNSLFEVNFDEKLGKLKAPKLVVNDFTETLFRNLVAFEHSGYHSKCITSYVIFMDSLIDYAEDVDLLVNSKIIDNRLEQKTQKIADLFNNLHKEFVEDSSDFYFADTCEKLNIYSKDRWHKFKAWWFRSKMILRRDYFGSPWSGISVIAASFLLVLTIIQTICSILQVQVK